MSADPSVLLGASAAEFVAAYPIEADRVRPHRVMDDTGYKIRMLAMGESAIMREHRAPVPILVQAVSGRILFRVGGSEYDLRPGGTIQVPAGVLHELEAVEDSHVLLLLLG